MAKIERFEDTEARWKACALLKAIYFATGSDAFVRAASSAAGGSAQTGTHGDTNDGGNE